MGYAAYTKHIITLLVLSCGLLMLTLITNIDRTDERQSVNASLDGLPVDCGAGVYHLDTMGSERASRVLAGWLKAHSDKRIISITTGSFRADGYVIITETIKTEDGL